MNILSIKDIHEILEVVIKDFFVWFDFPNHWLLYYYLQRLPPVAFDSAISELPHMKFESITINKGRHRTYIKANAKMNKKQYFDYRSTWFVDNIPVNSCK